MNFKLANTVVQEAKLQQGKSNSENHAPVEMLASESETNTTNDISEPDEIGEYVPQTSASSTPTGKGLLSSLVAPSGVDTTSSPLSSSRSINTTKSTSNRDFGKQFSEYTNFTSIKEKLHVPSFSSSSSSSIVSAEDGASKNATIKINAADIAALDKRLERLEKQAMIPTPKQKTVAESFVDSLKTDLLELSPKTIEICSTCGFFVVGCVLGASLLDRLWLVGGVMGAYWASHAVYKDSRGGVLARRLGVKVAQFIRDVQEKINGMIVFYRTGKLAMETSKWYEKYDKKYKIEDKMNQMKKLAMNRAADFKGLTEKIESNKYLDTIGDAWTVVTSVPNRAQKWDNKYKVTGNLVKFGKGLANTAQDGFLEILNRGADGWEIFNDGRRRQDRSRRRGTYDGLFGFMGGQDHSHRGNPVNPWDSPFKSLRGVRRRRRRRGSSRQSYRY